MFLLGGLNPLNRKKTGNLYPLVRFFSAKSREKIRTKKQSRGRKEKPRQVPCAVDHAHDFNVVFHDAVKNEILPDHKIAESGPDVLARRPDVGMFSQQGALGVNLIQQPVRGVRIVPGHILPDFNEIEPGPLGTDKARHGA